MSTPKRMDTSAWRCGGGMPHDSCSRGRSKMKRFITTLFLLGASLPGLALAGTLTIGCEATVPRPPIADPTRIVFGTVLPGEAAVDSTFVIHNPSTTTTWRVTFSLPQPPPPGCAGFSLVGGSGPFVLNPDGQVEGTVRLDPNVPGSESRICQVKVEYVLP